MKKEKRELAVLDLQEFKMKLDYNSVCKEIAELLDQKNTAYGTSVSDTFNDYGLTSYIIRLQDKVNRLKTLDKNKEISLGDEKIEDTLLDLAGYAILAISQLRNYKEGNHTSELVKYAENELELLLRKAEKEDKESYIMQKTLNEGIMEVIKLLIKRSI